MYHKTAERSAGHSLYNIVFCPAPTVTVSKNHLLGINRAHILSISKHMTSLTSITLIYVVLVLIEMKLKKKIRVKFSHNNKLGVVSSELVRLLYMKTNKWSNSVLKHQNELKKCHPKC